MNGTIWIWRIAREQMLGIVLPGVDLFQRIPVRDGDLGITLGECGELAAAAALKRQLPQAGEVYPLSRSPAAKAAWPRLSGL